MNVDLLLTEAKVFNVYLKEWMVADVAIHQGRILFVGKSSGLELSAHKILSCQKYLLVPGFIDIHMHIESSFLSPRRFAEAVLPHGTTTVVSEPHEMANVFGIEGVREMIKAGEGAAIDIYYGVPSSVPSTNSDVEGTGGVIDLHELKTLMEEEPKIVCLGEVMNYIDLVQMKEGRARNFTNFMRKNYPFRAIEGHVPQIEGFDLAKVLFAGVDSDHCLQTPSGIKARAEAGMFIEIQEKSITPENMAILNNQNMDGRFALVTDDVSPDTLLKKGHIDHLIRKAVKAGLRFESAILAATRSPAERIGFRDRGAIAPGRIADFVMLNQQSSTDISINQVIKGGNLEISEKETSLQEKKFFSLPFYTSINKLSCKENLFSIKAPSEKKIQYCRIIVKNKINTFTKEDHQPIPVQKGRLAWQKRDLNLVTVCNRYGSQVCAQGLIGGTIIREGAFCSSYAHDHHNILLVGDNPNDMEFLFSWLQKGSGGIAFASKGAIVAELSLPVAGLLSEAPPHEVAKRSEAIREALLRHGFEHPNPIMSLCTVTLPVSPSLKITDKGLVDTSKGEIVSLFVN
ncbi:adenine deaminase C-terminal domain-containing protein [Sediminispirochaeta bajacaliforniensis]|uniref:adenine deaminase C-terminal domain-containing protein n=1 Tax=Sediminispirochaeta bajacaliforniensis TaxID=148 RepID=UPI00036021C3|nr:adenine deaminase C-terminal domain-containing protein [Sediminispirochaeta bajacaliforniensis]